MYIYIFLFIVLSFLSITTELTKSLQKQRFCTFFAFTIIVLFQGLRWRTGTDWQPYLDSFMHSDISNRYNDEIGYFILNKLIKTITDSYTIFLLITCGINAYLVKRFTDYSEINNIACVLLYFFSVSIFPVRMTLAVSIFLQAYKYIEQRKLIPYLFIVGMAASIHAASIVTLPVYWIVNRYYKSFYLLIFYVICTLIGFLTASVFENLAAIFTLGIFQNSDFASAKIEHYMVENENMEDLLSLLLSLANGAIFISLFGYFRNKFYRNNTYYSLLLNMYVFGLCFNRVFLQTVPYMARVTAFYSGGFIIMILLIFNRLPQKHKPILIIGLCAYMYLAYSRVINGLYQDLYIPYYSVFSNTIRFYIY